MRNILERLRLEDRMVDDMREPEPFRQVVCDQSLSQLVGLDGIEQVQLVDPVERLCDGGRVEQVADDGFDTFGQLLGRTCSNEGAHCDPSPDELPDHLRAYHACPANHQYLHVCLLLN